MSTGWHNDVQAIRETLFSDHRCPGLTLGGRARSGHPFSPTLYSCSNAFNSSLAIYFTPESVSLSAFRIDSRAGAAFLPIRVRPIMAFCLGCSAHYPYLVG